MQFKMIYDPPQCKSCLCNKVNIWKLQKPLKNYQKPLLNSTLVKSVTNLKLWIMSSCLLGWNTPPALGSFFCSLAGESLIYYHYNLSKIDTDQDLFSFYFEWPGQMQCYFSEYVPCLVPCLTEKLPN